MISARFPFGLMRFLHPDGTVRDSPPQKRRFKKRRLKHAEIRAVIQADSLKKGFKRLMRDTE